MLANLSISGLYKDHLYKIYPEFMQKLSLKKFGVCECVHVFSMCQSKDNVSLLLIEIKKKKIMLPNFAYPLTDVTVLCLQVTIY